MTLRPTRLKDIIGQSNAKTILQISINACNQTNEVFPHCLVFGPPGTGKSTIAQAMSNELSKKLHTANGANIRSVKALLPHLMRINQGDILFIDEIHRLPINVAEFLYVAIEEYRVDLGKENQMSITLPKFTFFGATTNAGSIPKPLFDRFILKLPLELYTIDELSEIISKNSIKLKLNITDSAIKLIAGSSRNTPRIANNRLIWIRHYAISNCIHIINEEHILKALSLEGVNKNGIDNNDIKYLNALKRHQPAGINTLCSLTNIARDTIEEVIEPFLLRNNLIKKTSKGRMLC